MKISKELSTGSNAALVLSVLADEDMYGYKIIKDRFHDEKNEIRNIKWISNDLIAVEFKEDYRTDYQILEKVKDDTAIMEHILKFWE